MLGIRFIKVDPSTYLIKYKNGRVVKEGAGLSLFYYAHSTSLVSVPIGSEDIYFVFSELTKDFQEITIQGQVTYQIDNVHALTKMLNFTLNYKGEYTSNDPKKVSKRILNLTQVYIRKKFSELNLRESMSSAEDISLAVKTELIRTVALSSMGIEIKELSIIAIKPNQETARALETEAKEVLLRQADEAVYLRRNAAIEQERIIKENEINTEIAMEDKKYEIMEKHLEAERSEQEKRQKMKESELEGNIILQKQNEEFISLQVKNSKKEAEAKAYAIETHLSAIQKSDPKIVQVLAMSGMSPAQLIASSFKEIAENVEKIGELNISPDLLKQLMQKSYE
ncbi:MAG: SPFH domain-containing protein [Arcobacter sp.]|nr:SPFH domain-containing protein [Arcobacter sp.]